MLSFLNCPESHFQLFFFPSSSSLSPSIPSFSSFLSQGFTMEPRLSWNLVSQMLGLQVCTTAPCFQVFLKNLNLTHLSSQPVADCSDPVLRHRVTGVGPARTHDTQSLPFSDFSHTQLLFCTCGFTFPGLFFVVVGFLTRGLSVYFNLTSHRTPPT
jgi:hypothetical protein